MSNSSPRTSDITLPASLAVIGKQQLQLLQNLWEGVSYGIFVLEVLEGGQDFRYVAFNPAIARSSPVPVEHLLGKTITEALPEGMVALYRQHFGQCVHSGQPTTFEEQFCYAGEETWWLLTINPLFDTPDQSDQLQSNQPQSNQPQSNQLPSNQLQINQLLVTTIDITERVKLERDRQRAETESATSEAKFRHLIEGAEDVVAVWGLDGLLSYISPRFHTQFGFTVSDWVGQSFAPLVHPDDLPRCLAANQRMIETGEVQPSVEFRHRHQDGRWIWMAIKVAPVKDAAGHIIAMQGILRNIDDRKQQEADLHQSRQLLQSILDTLPVIVFWKDQNLIYQGCNQEALAACGLSSVEEIRGKTDYDLPWTTAEADWYRLCDRRVMDSGQAELNIVETQRQANGQQVTLNTNKVPLRDADGIVTGVLVTIEDITDRKLAEAEVAKLSLVASQTSNIVVITDASGLTEWVNESFARTTGYTLEEVQGKKPGHLLQGPLTDLETVQAIRTALQKQQPFQGEILNYHKDGHPYWLHLAITPILNQQSQVVQFVAIETDITARKAAEAALQDYADRQTLLNQLASQIRNSLDFDAVIATTLQSVQQLLDIDSCAFAWYDPEPDPSTWTVIQEANRAGIPSGLGCYSATLVGLKAQFFRDQDMLCIDDVEQYEEPIHQAFLRSIQCQSELLLPIQTSTQQVGILICCYHTQIHPWQASEIELLKAVSNQLAIAIDQAELYAESRAKSQELQQTLQELQLTQARMIQNEKMSSLGQLVAGIAHEVNNPVNFIHGNVTYTRDYVIELLELVALYQQVYPQPDAPIAEKIDSIDLAFLREDLPKVLSSMQSGTERIREIVKSLRLFSRLDEAEVKAVNLHESLDSTLMILQSRLNAKSDRAAIEIIKDYGDLPLVECFAGQLNQAFMNILMNAIDALDEQNEQRSMDEQKQYPSMIRITTTMTADRQAVIRIADNGPGIPPEIQPQIFDPFFTTKPVGQGTGMGMAISHQIVTEKHKGQLSCHSTVGQGTELIIQIPIACDAAFGSIGS